MNISIVATLYQSARYIAEFHERATASARHLAGDDYEIIFVNDGSPDNSLDIAVRLSEIDSHVVVVDLSRNFGHHKAMMTGLEHAKGENIFLIDSDLEEEPEWLIDFAERKANDNCDVVYGIQEQRKGGLFERWSGQWFYTIFRMLTNVELPRNLTTARLMSRRYVDALLRHKEREINIAGLWQITGFEQHPFVVRKHSFSKTTYTFRRKMAHLVNAITSFSNVPLVFIFNVGLSIFALSACYTGYLLLTWLFFAKPLNGWTSVMASIWILGGLIISFIGIVGIYVSKIFTETKQRPSTIVRAIYRKQRQDPRQ
jgi:putative glycosyltransferase